MNYCWMFSQIKFMSNFKEDNNNYDEELLYNLSLDYLKKIL